MTSFPIIKSHEREHPSSPDDLRLLRSRDPRSWSALFEREHPLVFRAVLAQTRDRAVAEDVTAQVFVEAIEGIERYHDRGKPITVWLLSIARHRVLDWHRKQRRMPAPEFQELSTPGPEDGIGDALAALSDLTPEQREVIHLRIVEGYELSEVAVLTGRSVGAVKALQHRALERLRATFGVTNTRLAS